MKAAAAGRATAWEMVKKGAANAAVKEAAKTAGEKVAEAATGGLAQGGGNFVTQRRANRMHKRLAFDLAKQIGGSYSARTVIAGERYFVVWGGDEPVEVFPRLPRTSVRWPSGPSYKISRASVSRRRRRRRTPAEAAPGRPTGSVLRGWRQTDAQVADRAPGRTAAPAGPCRA